MMVDQQIVLFRSPGSGPGWPDEAAELNAADVCAANDPAC